MGYISEDNVSVNRDWHSFLTTGITKNKDYEKDIYCDRDSFNFRSLQKQ